MTVLRYLLSGIARRCSPWLLGRHPYNTWLSFNWSNLRHLRKFMRDCAQQIAVTEATIVDVGAGRLPYFHFLQDKAGRYIAVDAEAVLNIDIDIVDPRIERCIGTAESLPLDDASADVVIMNQVLEHVDSPDQSLTEISRVLKPGGLFIGSVPHISPVHLEPQDFRRYTDLGVRQLLQRHGFEMIRLSQSGGVYSSAALLVAMDWVLSARREASPQQFSELRAFWLAPVIGVLNIGGYLGDRWLPQSGRSPANLAWIARRPG